MSFESWYRSLWGYDPFPWQSRLAAAFAQGEPPDAITAPTASGKTSSIDAWIWALAEHPDQVSRRFWYVVQRRVLVDDAYSRAIAIRQKLDTNFRRKLAAISATGEELIVLCLRGGVFEDMGAFDVSSPMVLCSTADQHMSRLLFRGYGVTDNSKPLHAALAGTRATVVVDEAHIIPTYETNLRHASHLGAELHVISMTATPGTDAVKVQRLSLEDRDNDVLRRRIATPKPTTLMKGKIDEIPRIVKKMISAGSNAVVVFCNTASNASQVCRKIPNAWLLTGRVREYDRKRMTEILAPLRSGAEGPKEPTVVVATQTLEVGADLDFDGLVTESASLSSLRQRFGRLNRLGTHDNVWGYILSDGRKQTPVYGKAAINTFKWLQRVFEDEADMSTDSVDRKLREYPPEESLSASQELGPSLNEELVETWRQTNPRRLWDVPVADFIDPSDDTSVALMWRDEPLEPNLIETCPPHPQESAPVPISAVKAWAEDRAGIRYRGPGSAVVCNASQLVPGDVWILQVDDDDGRIELGCTLSDSPADVADVSGERIRVSEQLAQSIEDGMSLDAIAVATGIIDPVITPRGDRFIVTARKRFDSLASSGNAITLEEHSQAVGNLAGRIAESLGLDSELLKVAGVLHDIGKADPRMQAWMGGTDTLLAKSVQSPRSLFRMRPEDLPKGWRHEMLSTRMLPANVDPQLADLVASHHGRCRPSIPKCADNGEASVVLSGNRFEAQGSTAEELEAEAIERFANMGNPWTHALRQSVLVMADRLASRDILTAPIEPFSIRVVETAHTEMSFTAPALDGTALLGWLAAVGALRVLSRERATTLHWDPMNRAVFGGWESVEAVDWLTEQLSQDPKVFKPKDQSDYEQLGVWGPGVWRFDGQAFKQSPLLATGGGQTGLERAWPKLAKATTREKVCEALESWTYYPKLGQRWDTAEHVEHGSQWSDPSRAGSRSVHGASRMAIEALPVLPTLFGRTTIGFDSTQHAATWPVWRSPLTLAGVRVAVRQPMIERWMSRKIGVGQLASFLPSEPCERSRDAEIPATARVAVSS